MGDSHSQSGWMKVFQFFIHQIRLLFDIGERIQSFSDEEKFLIRQSESKPIMDAIQSQCRVLKNGLPQSPLGKAIHYTLKLWKGLTVFLDHPEVPIYMNTIERAQRSPVLGRKNYYGSKTLDSAQISVFCPPSVVLRFTERVIVWRTITTTALRLSPGRSNLWESRRQRWRFTRC